VPTKLQELTLIYRRERIRWDNKAILECAEPEPAGGNGDIAALCEEVVNGKFDGLLAGPKEIIVKTDCEPEELTAGLSYRFYGTWQTHDRHGKQFIANSVWRVEPHDRGAVIRYLQTLCAGHGIGRATAEKLWEKFGGQAVKMLRTQPETAAAAVGMQHFTVEKARGAAAILEIEKATEDTIQDLLGILGGRGFPRDAAKKCIKEWGARAAGLLKKNPYLLRTIYSGRFLQTDKLYLDQGGNPAALKRQALCAWYAIAGDTEGHTWHRPQTVEFGIRSRISGAAVQPIPAMLLAKRARMISVLRNGDGVPWLAESRKADNERTVAEHVRTMLEAPCQWPDAAGLDISEHQAAELDKALKTSIAILAGSPGTGKTRTLTRLVARVIELAGTDSVCVHAPTGKAAVRVTQALAECGISKTATTTHRLLGIASRTAGEGWGFVHDEHNPLPYKYVIGDEESMRSTDMMASLLRACAVGTHVLLVGDTNQLPPIEHGRPLYDMIAAGVSCGNLTELWRNAGNIVKTCAAIRDRKPWRFDRHLDLESGANLLLKETRSNAESQERIVETLGKLRSLGFDPKWDAQVLVSVNKKSEVSRVEMNKLLQGVLNPNGKQVAGCPFLVGDKIIRIKRNTLMPVVGDAGPNVNQDAVDGKVLVANGEMGLVVAVEAKRAFAKFTAPERLIVIPFGKAGDGDENGDSDEEKTTTGCDFDLGYACTVHKFQGSEIPIALYALDDSGGAMRLGSRELFYTGISRGKKCVICFGKEHTAKAMCLRQVVTKRKTFLKELISGTVK
jgi:exodeoxyribonuclease V alpha subunit